MDLRVGKNYQLIKKIGSGAFGEIYEGIQSLSPSNPFNFVRQTHPNQGVRRHQTGTQFSNIT